MHIKLATTLIIVTLLAGCSGAPSESEVRDALSREMTLQTPSFMQVDIPGVVAKIKVLGCSKADTSGYVCDIQGVEGQVSGMRFVKTDKGWSVARK